MNESGKRMEAYVKECAEKVQKTDFAVLGEIADAILAVKQRGGRIFTAGNGGSSATASHVVNDLVKGCRVENRPGFDAMCLSDSSAVVTCLGNDFSYGEIYRVQLETFAKEGDLLLVYSGSGNSENIVQACRYAREHGIFVVGFGGRDGGKMKPLCDLCLLSPTDSMEQLEDMHLIYEHALVTVLRERL